MADETDIGIDMFLFLAGLFIVILLLYAVAVFASIAITSAIAGGTLWGGGTAIANYGKSFKENMIDSNRAIFA